MKLFKHSMMLIASLFFITSSYSSDAVDINSIGTTVDESSLYGNYQNDFTGKNGSDVLSTLKSRDSNRKACKIVSYKSGKFMESANNFFVVAKVNNDIITNVDIINAVKFVFFSSGKQYDKKNAKLMVNTIINTMIDDKLHQQYAKLYKLQVNEKEINDKIEEIAKNNGVTVEELGTKFEELGISMEIFKKNIKSRMLLQFIIKIIGDTTTVTEQEILEAKNKAMDEINKKRYHLLEIFFRIDDKKNKEKIKENAESVLKLLKEGFSFQVMAETLSQGTYSGTAGDLGWVREENIENAILPVVKNLKCGEFSNIIETRTGYKIVCLLDKAEPGKSGQKQTSYSVISSKIKYKGGIQTQKDIQKTNEMVGSIMEAKTPEKYKEICKKHKISIEETNISSPNEYYFELINKSKKTGKPAVLQSIEDEDSINILMFISENTPGASVPTHKELFEKISSKKIEDEFLRNFKKIRATAHTEIFKDKLAGVF